MYLCLSIDVRNTCAVERPKIIKAAKLVVFYFKYISICTVCVSIVGIKHHRLLLVARYLHPKLDVDYITMIISLGILERVVYLLGVLDLETELLLPRLIQKFIVSCILG